MWPINSFLDNIFFFIVRIAAIVVFLAVAITVIRAFITCFEVGCFKKRKKNNFMSFRRRYYHEDDWYYEIDRHMEEEERRREEEWEEDLRWEEEERHREEEERRWEEWEREIEEQYNDDWDDDDDYFSKPKTKKQTGVISSVKKAEPIIKVKEEEYDFEAEAEAEYCEVEYEADEVKKTEADKKEVAERVILTEEKPATHIAQPEDDFEVLDLGNIDDELN